MIFHTSSADRPFQIPIGKTSDIHYLICSALTILLTVQLYEGEIHSISSFHACTALLVPLAGYISFSSFRTTFCSRLCPWPFHVLCIHIAIAWCRGQYICYAHTPYWFSWSTHLLDYSVCSQLTHWEMITLDIHSWLWLHAITNAW